MSDVYNDDIKASAQIVGCSVLYKLEKNLKIIAGDIIASYIDDYEIGKSELVFDESGDHIYALINIDKFPKVKFPAFMRSVVINKNFNLPYISFEKYEDILNIVPWSGANAKIVSITNDELICEVDVDSLPSYSRNFTLIVNDVVMSTSKSTIMTSINRSKSETHRINFKISKKLRERDDIIILDTISNKVVLEKSLDWFAMTKIISDMVEANKKDIISMQEEMQRLKSKIDFTTSISLDKQGLERIDIYYSLLNTRIDRIIASNNIKAEEMDYNQSSSCDEYGQQQSLSSRINASEIEGVGVYELETENGREWRWVAPRVTLAFRNVPRLARTIVLHFWMFKPEHNAECIMIDVNGRSVKANSRRQSDDWELHIPINQHNMNERDRTVIAHIQFKEFSQSDTDPRLLSALLSYATYEA